MFTLLAQYQNYGYSPIAPAPSAAATDAMLTHLIVGALFWVVVIVGVVLGVRRRGKSGTTLVLTGFRVDPAATDGPCIDITGRPTGLTAYVLTALGLSTETRLVVTDLQVSVHRSSLSGEFNDIVPLTHVSSTHCGYSKPFALLVVAAVALAGGIFGGLALPNGGAVVILLGLVAAAVLVVVYALSKKINIQVVADSSVTLPLTFRPSLLNGVPVNIAATNDALALLNQKVLQAGG